MHKTGCAQQIHQTEASKKKKKRKIITDEIFSGTERPRPYSESAESTEQVLEPKIYSSTTN